MDLSGNVTKIDEKKEDAVHYFRKIFMGKMICRILLGTVRWSHMRCRTYFFFFWGIHFLKSWDKKKGWTGLDLENKVPRGSVVGSYRQLLYPPPKPVWPPPTVGMSPSKGVTIAKQDEDRQLSPFNKTLRSAILIGGRLAVLAGAGYVFPVTFFPFSKRIFEVQVLITFRKLTQ